jgi:peptidoglycan hydrolase-like protein with peptidoglycan-binding domain
MTLKRGDKGSNVIELQKILNAKGFFKDAFVENFGPKTEAAVKAYQASINLTPDGIVSEDLWTKLTSVTKSSSNTLTVDVLKNTCAVLGYKWYTDRPNIICIRTTLDVPETFNDYMCIVYPNAGKETLKVYPNTTQPGVYWLKHPLNSLGTAVLKPGQYVNSHSIGFHQNKADHKALVQTGPVVVYRDGDLDNNAEEQGTEQKGLFGINIHGANKNIKTMAIGKWSAGCQVFQIWQDKEEFVSICEKFKTVTGNKFTLTLLKESQLVF